MQFLQRALEALPAAAANPLALIAFLATVAAWFWYAYQQMRFKEVSKHVEQVLKPLGDVPKAKLAETIREALKTVTGVVLPTDIDPEQYIRARRQVYFLIAFLALCVLVLCLFAIASWKAVHSKDEVLQGLRQQIDADEAKLQRMLERERQQLVVAAEASGEARVLARYQPSPEIKELAEHLKALVAEFTAEAGIAAMTDADSRRMRLAEGTAANAEGRYQDALSIVTEDDASKAESAAEARIEQAVKSLRVRADGYYGLRQWNEAGSHYGRILKYRTGDLAAALGVGNCLALLGRLSDALECYNEAVEIVTRVVDQEGRQESAADLIACLNNRGNALRHLGKVSEALKDFDRAVAIDTRLVDQEGRTDRADELAGSLNNCGVALRALGRLSDALEDQSRAVGIYTKLVEQQGRKELAKELAASMSNRGSIFYGLGKHSEAVKDFVGAVGIFTNLVEQEGRKELAADLARSLGNRGAGFRAQGRLSEAVKDFDRAVDILTRLVDQERRQELANDLARILRNRAEALSRQDKPDAARSDLVKASSLAIDPELRLRIDEMLQDFNKS